jgi:hypothetical protein
VKEEKRRANMSASKAKQLTTSIPLEAFVQAFKRYNEGATVEIITEDGSESVQISRMIWTGGKISLLGYVPKDTKNPYRHIHLNSMLETGPDRTDTITRTDKTLLEKA